MDINLYHTGVLVSEIAAMLDAEWEGDGLAEIRGAAPLESAGPDQLSFVANRKAVAAAEQSQAGCLIVPDDFPAGRTLIRSRDPRTAFARAVTALYPKPAIAPGAHDSAVIALDALVDPSASIGPHASIGSGSRVGPGTRIGASCSIASGVTIGADCTLYPHVSIYDGVSVGDRVIVHSGAVIGADGFGFAFANGQYEKFPQVGRVEIGNDVEIGANTCIDRAALGVTSIGDGTKLDNMVHVGHNCRIGRHVVVAAQTGFSGGVVVEDYAVIGGQVGIGDKARIESGAVLGSGCGILTSKIVRKGQVVWGTPARPLKEHLEQLANLARLPELRRQVAELRKQIEALEKAAGQRFD
ncbi:MAG: UDP-3-O-(3-hydroxymyristoyl)glucosamine N-acyltransferase [Bryobacteraceae bacterium]|jgi:UDP-3-O-[3-hydroxymyristoyl] glucosamine N-acyltransferase